MPVNSLFWLKVLTFEAFLVIRKDYPTQSAAVCQGLAVTKSIDTISQDTQDE